MASALGRIILVFVLSFLSQYSAFASDDTALSYNELAKVRVLTVYNSVKDEIAAFGPSTLPHEAKKLRKNIGQLRDYLDLFVYAYSANQVRDVGLELRETLDVGYETMGQFKDLFDVQTSEDPSLTAEQAKYEEASLNERRNKVLRWRAAFLSERTQKLYVSYISQPDTALFSRAKDDLSKFYWGSVNFEPKSELTGFENIRRLVIGLLERSIENEQEAYHIGNLTKYENEESFHDFRKRVRSVLKIISYFDSLKPASEIEKEAHKLLETMVERYGAVNDRIVAFHQAEENKQKKRAEKIEEEIKVKWKNLLIWQRDANVANALKQMKERFENQNSN